jgi:hypothetical protein
LGIVADENNTPEIGRSQFSVFFKLEKNSSGYSCIFKAVREEVKAISKRTVFKIFNAFTFEFNELLVFLLMFNSGSSP